MGQHKGEWYQILDDQPVLEFFKENAGVSAQELTTLAAARTDFWGEDLSGYPEFAAKAGISQNTLARMGKGQFISMELLVRICKYLNCTFDDVVEIIDKEKIES